MIERSKYLMDVAAFAALLVAGLLTAQQQGCMPAPGPTPGPVDPVDPVDPEPNPEPIVSPIEADGLHVLIVEETSSRSRLTPEQIAIFSDTKWRDYVQSKSGHYRALDKDTEFLNADDPFKQAMERPREAIPWLIVSNRPKGGVEMPLPATREELLQVLKTWGEK